jgi:hypothetical protein
MDSDTKIEAKRARDGVRCPTDIYGVFIASIPV